MGLLHQGGISGEGKNFAEAQSGQRLFVDLCYGSPGLPDMFRHEMRQFLRGIPFSNSIGRRNDAKSGHIVQRHFG